MWHVGERMKCERMVSDGVRRPTRMGSQQPRAEPNSQSLCGKHDTSPTGRTRSTLNDATPRQPDPHEDLLHTRRPPNTNQRHYTCTQLYSADCPVRKAPRARLRTAPPPQSHTASVSHRLSRTLRTLRTRPGSRTHIAPTRLPRLMRSARGLEELSHTAARS